MMNKRTASCHPVSQQATNQQSESTQAHASIMTPLNTSVATINTNNNNSNHPTRFLQFFSQFEQNIPLISAMSWTIHDFESADLLWSKQPNEQREMASLTKIMTIYACLEACEKFYINLDQIIKVPRIAAWTIGTTACLREGDSLSLMDLLHALMLPSGNDAANTIANFIGRSIIVSPTSSQNRKKLALQELTMKENCDKFITYMNRLAYQIGLKNTNFSNAHGLSCKSNKSTANDLGRLACIAMKQYPLIRKIGNTQQYTCTVIDFNARPREITWANTNLLLDKEGFEGLKTGWTPNAGPCLSVLYYKEDVKILITLMNSKSTERRFQEAARLAHWAENRLTAIQKSLKTVKSPIRIRCTSLYQTAAGRNSISQAVPRVKQIKTKLIAELSNTA